MPRVSVIIPAYNAALFIGEAIESILAQSFQDFEIIVVDDGSTDGTAEVVKKFPQVRFIEQPHSGIAVSRNAGILAARGELIAWIDADDRWTKDKLEKQVDWLDQHPETGMLLTRYRNFTDLPEEALSKEQKELLGIEVVRLMVTAVIRKELFDRLGLFDASLAYSEDSEWIRRVDLRCIGAIAKLGEILYERRIHTSNITLTHKDISSHQAKALYTRALLNLRKQEKGK
ncbi:MAG: glycosyltransferase family 2 protein [Solobacterium sp.]|nr:glycosyltransferase family 2 protein [Solobacterium sp.]